MAAAPNFSVDVEVKPTLRTFDEYKTEMNESLIEGFHKVTDGVVERAFPNVPVRTGALKATLRATVNVVKDAGGDPAMEKSYANVSVGVGKRIPYGPPVHWGWGWSLGPKGGVRIPQDPDDWFIFREAHPQATATASGPFADWIVKDMTEAFEGPLNRLDRKLAKGVRGV